MLLTCKENVIKKLKKYSKYVGHSVFFFFPLGSMV